MDFSLENFTGPLDLLLQLIDRNQVDIMNIPISEIANQFAECVAGMDGDMETISEFLSMTATLLDIKCRMLLQKEEQVDNNGEETDPRLELVRKLLEYKMYRQMGRQLIALSESASKVFYKKKTTIKTDATKESIDYDALIGKRTAYDLYRSYLFSLSRKKQRRDPVRAEFGKIQKEEVDTEKQEKHICSWIKYHPQTTFSAMTKANSYREETIVDFLLVLEMAKTGKIELQQENTYAELKISKRTE